MGALGDVSRVGGHKELFIPVCQTECKHLVEVSRTVLKLASILAFPFIFFIGGNRELSKVPTGGVDYW
jgi:hypothetical protein